MESISRQALAERTTSSALARVLLAACILAVGCVAAPHDRDGVEGPLTFDEYVASLPRDDTGAYLINGHVPVWDRDALEDHYAEALYGTALTVDQTSQHVDIKYTASRAMDLSYCIPSSFSAADQATLRAAINSAAAEWESSTNIYPATSAPSIDFREITLPAGQVCDANNTNVFFNIRRAADNIDFEMRSFGPQATRGQRELLVTPSAFFALGAQTLTSLFRHELGHILGFVDEYSYFGQCGEDPYLRPITVYDLASVMSYNRFGQCVDTGSVEYKLSTHDSAGVRCLYTTQARLANDTAGDACRALTGLSTTATSFAMARNDAFYRLTSTASGSNVITTVSMYINATKVTPQDWTQLWSATVSPSTASTAIYAGGEELYRATPTSLYRWVSSTNAWSLVGAVGSKVVVDYISGDLFRLNSNGTIDRVAAGQSSPTAILSTTATGRKIFAGTTELFRLESNGDAYMWTPTAGWSARIGTGIKALAKSSSGQIFCLLNDTAGSVMLRNSSGGWDSLGSGSSAIWGGLETPYASMKNDSTTTADESKIIRRHQGGTSWKKYALDSNSIMMGTDFRVAININGRPYAYENP